MKVEIDNHLESFNYDIRKTGNARFMDQKVTPDVLYVIANCVIHFIDNSSNIFFQRKIYGKVSSQMMRLSIFLINQM